MWDPVRDPAKTSGVGAVDRGHYVPVQISLFRSVGEEGAHDTLVDFHFQVEGYM